MLRSLLRRLRGDDGGQSNARSETPTDDTAASDGAETGEDDADAEPNGEMAEGQANEDEDGSLWDLIHPWQYRGQYVQSGGDVRDEQERALRDIQRQAEEIEGSEVEHEPPAEK